MRLLIVQTGVAPTAVRRVLGDYPEWFRRGLGLRRDQISCVRVDRGATLPPARAVAAILVTGSSAMVSERRDWSERTARWLRGAVDVDTPILGVCYGHQLLAHALGGRVDYNPRGEEVGTVTVHRIGASADDLLLADTPKSFTAHSTHAQSVLRPPRDAVVLARSKGEECQGIRFADRAWGVQFHPEFGVREMRAFIRDDAELLDAAGVDARALQRKVEASPHARSVLRRFARTFV